MWHAGLPAIAWRRSAPVFFAEQRSGGVLNVFGKDLRDLRPGQRLVVGTFVAQGAALGQLVVQVAYEARVAPLVDRAVAAHSSEDGERRLSAAQGQLVLRFVDSALEDLEELFGRVGRKLDSCGESALETCISRRTCAR